MSQKRSGCLTAVIVVSFVVSIILNVAFVAGRSSKMVRASMQSSASAPFGEEIMVPASGEDSGKRVAVISLRGVISSAEPGQVNESSLEDLVAELKQAAEDRTISAVVLRIDSPGGEVTASDILYKQVLKVRALKPVVVSMDSVAASGGFYVACAGSHIFAHETTITASIGVIMQSVNYQNLLGKVGLEVNTFKSGAFKDLLNGARELTEAEREYVQGLIDQSYSRFVGIVAKERNLDESALRAGVADGRIVSGVDALNEKLVDELGGFDEALAKARELGKAPGAAAVRYSAPMAFGRLIRFLSEAPVKSGKVRVDLGAKFESILPSGRLYFMSPVLVP
jgi:protease-4